LEDFGTSIPFIFAPTLPTKSVSLRKIERLLDAVFPTKTTDEWMNLLNSVDILATPVQEYRDILTNEQALAND